MKPEVDSDGEERLIAGKYERGTLESVYESSEEVDVIAWVLLFDPLPFVPPGSIVKKKYSLCSMHSFVLSTNVKIQLRWITLARRKLRQV